jgi:hypothetical protein
MTCVSALSFVVVQSHKGTKLTFRATQVWFRATKQRATCRQRRGFSIEHDPCCMRRRRQKRNAAKKAAKFGGCKVSPARNITQRKLPKQASQPEALLELTILCQRGFVSLQIVRNID